MADEVSIGNEFTAPQRMLLLQSVRATGEGIPEAGMLTLSAPLYQVTRVKDGPTFKF